MVIIVVMINGSNTLDRRKYLSDGEEVVIDFSTGERATIRQDILEIKEQIETGTISEEYLAEADQKAVMSLYEYANKHQLSDTDKRMQQLVYNLYKIKYQQDAALVLFGNGYLNSYPDLILEMEGIAFLLNFGIAGFILYVGPFLAIFLYAVYKGIKKINPDLNIMCKASAYVDEDQLKSEEAMLFGCSTDYNVYTMSENPKPEGDKTNLRTTGCHLHIGYDNPNVDTSTCLVKYLDSILGICSIFLDEDTDRRKLYGKAGCFRLTSYGVEYRVLSGAFIRNKIMTETMYDLMYIAIHEFNSCRPIPPDNIIQNIIDGNDKQLGAMMLMKYYAKRYPVVNAAIGGIEYIKNYYKANVETEDNINKEILNLHSLLGVPIGPSNTIHMNILQ